jgi:hypothetical protein
MDIYLLIGITGMLCVLFSFLMVQRHRWTQDDLAYDLLNAVGSALLVINAVALGAWPFAILNAIWAGYSLRDVIFLDKWKLTKRKKTMRRAG